MEKKYWKSQGKVREFCQSEKVGTLSNVKMQLVPLATSSFFLKALHRLTLCTSAQRMFRTIQENRVELKAKLMDCKRTNFKEIFHGEQAFWVIVHTEM